MNPTTTFSITNYSLSLKLCLFCIVMIFGQTKGQVRKSYPPISAMQEDSIADSTCIFIVYKNNFSCLNCFQMTDEYLCKLRQKHKLLYIISTECDSNLFTIRRNTGLTKKSLPNADRYYYFPALHEGTVESSQFITPSLELIKNGKHLYIPYEELIDTGGLYLTKKAQYEIENFLK